MPLTTSSWNSGKLSSQFLRVSVIWLQSTMLESPSKCAGVETTPTGSQGTSPREAKRGLHFLEDILSSEGTNRGLKTSCVCFISGVFFFLFVLPSMYISPEQLDTQIRRFHRAWIDANHMYFSSPSQGNSTASGFIPLRSLSSRESPLAGIPWASSLCHCSWGVLEDL